MVQTNLEMNICQFKPFIIPRILSELWYNALLGNLYTITTFIIIF